MMALVSPRRPSAAFPKFATPCGFEFEVPEQAYGNCCRNFKFAALNLVPRHEEKVWPGAALGHHTGARLSIPQEPVWAELTSPSGAESR
jgi:hypothetical protein